MYRSVVVKSCAKTQDRLIFVPDLTVGHELWVMREQMRSRIQETEKSFLCRVAGLSLRDKRRLVNQGRLRVESLLLHMERNQLKRFIWVA